MKNFFKRLLTNPTPAAPEQSESLPTGNVQPTLSIPATKAKREEIIKFIINGLKPYIDEKGHTIAGLRLYVVCNSKELEETLKVALCDDTPGMFQKDHLERKLINNFIQLAGGWFFEHHLVNDKVPDYCITRGSFGLEVIRRGQDLFQQYSVARLQVLVGQTEFPEYELDPQQQLKFNIGRTKNPKLSTGRIHTNDIVFWAQDDPQFDAQRGTANLHVSRNHAYILYNPQLDKFFLFPDKGGLPENGNKTRIYTTDDKMKSLNVPGVSHELENGDQIELGGAAILVFMKV
ncbi:MULTISPECIES: FHA domain-containing protein [Niastella]|uniref:FHA domain-containing protein n=1 Tax=Niastella soli TaxID=2821487 RepID=A0ABS3Z070_9BACT|nr:FHA domain-containing protein [Niastella soli]MBO9203413.1 FHA domain-containing protein [Niastella soli]